jgi:uncharacterized integral membrane protein
MQFLTWLIRIVLFVVLVGFAASNRQPTELKFFSSELIWHAPLVLHLLAFFIGGVVVGLLAAMPGMFRQRREIARLRRDVDALRQPASPLPTPIEIAAAHLPIH